MNKEKIPVVDNDAGLADGIDLFIDMVLPAQNSFESYISLKQIATENSYIMIKGLIEDTGDLSDDTIDSGEITSLDEPVDMLKIEASINSALAVKKEATSIEPMATDDVNTNILVVEDDEVLQQILCDLLELKKGYNVSAAGTGEEALTQASNRLYDVALVDLTLPDIEGLELLRQLKKMCPKTQCIVLTGKVSEEIASTAVGEIAFAYLIKPSSADEILNAVEKALGK